MAGVRIATYEDIDGPVAGLIFDDHIVNAALALHNTRYVSVLAILEDWEKLESRLDQAARSMAERRPLEAVRLLAPVLYPSAIYCAGANYTDHVQEMAAVLNIAPEPEPHALGLKPWHFIKPSRAAVGHGSDVTLPTFSTKVDWEAELVAVIGRRAKDVSVASALDYVAGYTIANDLSARDFVSRPHVAPTSPFKYDWISQKCWDSSCPVGPWIVPARDIGDSRNLKIELRVNGVLKQQSNTSQMIFDTAEQIAQLSTRMTLQPGDMILTGTPAGVGLARNEFLKAGDFVEVEIEKIGTLSNTFRK